MQLNPLNKKKKNVAIIGLGYVGLPLFLKFLKSNKYNLIGIDKDLIKIKNLIKKKSYISHISKRDINYLTENANILSDKYYHIKKCHTIIFALPTPITKNKDPDMSYIYSSLQSAKKYISRNQLLILESTVYPGATADLFLPIIKQKNLTIGKNIFLGYSPEREDPGNLKYNISNIVKLVSGFSRSCLLKCNYIYNSINIKTKKVSSIKTAEITKLYENIFRSVNIGLVNEMKLISDKMNLDIYEIIEAAKTKPFGFKAFYPGPGLGGHCIPIDPYLLTWKAKQYDMHTKFIELSGDINNSMPDYVVEKINISLNKINKNFYNSKIFIIGIAYKKNINDLRESPSLKIMEKLHSYGAKLSYNDEFIKFIKIKINKKNFSLRKKDLILRSTEINRSNLKSADVVCIITDHDYVDYNLVKKLSKIIVDCRGRFKKNNKIIKA